MRFFVTAGFARWGGHFLGVVTAKLEAERSVASLSQAFAASGCLQEQALDAAGYNKRPEINLGAFFLSFALVTPTGFKMACKRQ